MKVRKIVPDPSPVTIQVTMTEREAEVLRMFLGGTATEDLRRAQKWGAHPPAQEFDSTVYDLYMALADGLS